MKVNVDHLMMVEEEDNLEGDNLEEALQVVEEEEVVEVEAAVEEAEEGAEDVMEEGAVVVDAGDHLRLSLRTHSESKESK